MDISRRLFVKTTAVALASAAAAGTMSTLVGCAGGGQTSASADGAGETYLSVCRFCGCGCGVICEVKDGRLVSVTGDPDNGSNRGLNLSLIHISEPTRH